MNRHTKRFILSSLIYFLFGCALGLVAVVDPDLVSMIRPVHAHINLLGWVTMMIIGVTYFVIPVFVRKEPYSDRLVTLHLVLANLGIVGMAISFVIWDEKLLAISALVEVASAYLFLFNIISTAIKGAPVDKGLPEWEFLMGENDAVVDRWASSFTKAATYYFVISCTLGGYMALYPSAWGYMRIHFHINLLGWVTMMIYGVAYHIFPRFSGRPVQSAGLVRTNFIFANAGLLLMVAALTLDTSRPGTGLAANLIAMAGIVEGISGVIFVYNILPSVTGAVATMGRASVQFVSASLSYLMLGIGMGVFMAVRPGLIETLLPVHAHINVLGWITMMIFGVGYYIIPSFSGKRLYSQRLAGINFWVANAGLIGFLSLLSFREGAGSFIIFFALVELFSAAIFIFNIAKSIFPEKQT